MQNNIITVDNSSEIEEQIYTLIEINDNKFAISSDRILEIIKITELDYPKKLPSCILGIMKYHNLPCAVIDIREIFKFERITYDLKSEIVIINTKDGINAIICDKVLDVKKLNKSCIYPLPYQKEDDFYDGIYTKDEETIYLINIDNIVNYIKINPEKFESNDLNINYVVCDENSKEILKERKESLALVARETENNTPLYDMGVAFAVDNVKYYINMSSVKEFFKVNNAKFISVPCVPSYIFGLINIKGEYVTIIDIRQYFNNPKTTLKEKSTIIILNSEEFKIGILADEISETMNVDYSEIMQNKIQNQDENKLTEFIKDGEIYQVIDAEKLLKDERLTIA